MTVSVIVPYIETSDLILKTADSLLNQRKVDTSQLQLLVADATAEQSAKDKLASYNNVRIIEAPGANEAEAYNAALNALDADCAIVARPGDVFGSHYFMNALKALTLKKDYAFAAPQRFCINPVYTRYKYISRTNAPVKFLNAVGAPKALVVLPESDPVVVKSCANIPGVETTPANCINVYDILKYGKLVVAKDAIAKIEEVYAE